MKLLIKLQGESIFGSFRISPQHLHFLCFFYDISRSNRKKNWKNEYDLPCARNAKVKAIRKIQNFLIFRLRHPYMIVRQLTGENQ